MHLYERLCPENISSTWFFILGFPFICPVCLSFSKHPCAYSWASMSIPLMLSAPSKMTHSYLVFVTPSGPSYCKPSINKGSIKPFRSPMNTSADLQQLVAPRALVFLRSETVICPLSTPVCSTSCHVTTPYCYKRNPKDRTRTDKSISTSDTILTAHHWK